jgi:protoheme IX farnesyltransferase
MNPRAVTIEDQVGGLRDSLGAYYELVKPRVLLMVLITALAGFYLGAGIAFEYGLALKMLFGVALSAGGTLALNQYFERDTDAIMERTRHRPIPQARVNPTGALVFGLTTTATGLVFLWTDLNPLAAIVTSAISVLYLAAYTPMKRYSWMCHVIGAVPGALPPVIGWAAARDSISFEPFVLFGMMFLWQLPHSLSIARLYQADYARAGLSLLPRDRSWGNPAGVLMLVAAALLTIFGTLPTWMAFAGRVYLVTSILLGLWMLYNAIGLVRGSITARRVMLASLIYLPAALLVMVIDKI